MNTLTDFALWSSANSLHQGSNIPSFRSQAVDEERMRPVSFSALILLVDWQQRCTYATTLWWNKVTQYLDCLVGLSKYFQTKFFLQVSSDFFESRKQITIFKVVVISFILWDMWQISNGDMTRLTPTKQLTSVNSDIHEAVTHGHNNSLVTRVTHEWHIVKPVTHGEEWHQC